VLSFATTNTTLSAMQSIVRLAYQPRHAFIVSSAPTESLLASNRGPLTTLSLFYPGFIEVAVYNTSSRTYLSTEYVLGLQVRIPEPAQATTTTSMLLTTAPTTIISLPGQVSTISPTYSSSVDASQLSSTTTLESTEVAQSAAAPSKMPMYAGLAAGVVMIAAIVLLVLFRRRRKRLQPAGLHASHDSHMVANPSYKPPAQRTPTTDDWNAKTYALGDTMSPTANVSNGWQGDGYYTGVSETGTYTHATCPDQKAGEEHYEIPGAPAEIDSRYAYAEPVPSSVAAHASARYEYTGSATTTAAGVAAGYEYAEHASENGEVTIEDYSEPRLGNGQPPAEELYSSTVTTPAMDTLDRPPPRPGSKPTLQTLAAQDMRERMYSVTLTQPSLVDASKLTRDEARELLTKGDCTPGSYVLRLREGAGRMAISLLVKDGTVIHYRLKQDGGFVFQSTPLPLSISSLSACMQYLSSNEGARHVKLPVALGACVTPEGHASSTVA
jgi:hypothetical protein